MSDPIDNERRLVDAAGRVRAAASASPPPTGEALALRARARTRRRHTLTAAAVVALLVPAVGVVALLGRSTDIITTADDTTTSATTPVPNTSAPTVPCIENVRFGSPYPGPELDAATARVRSITGDPTTRVDLIDGTTVVDLPPNGRSVAERLAGEFGPRLVVGLGAKRFGVDAGGTLRRCSGDKPPGLPYPDLFPLPAGFTYRPAPGSSGRTFRTGEDVVVEVEITADRPWTLTTVPARTADAWLTLPGSLQPVSAGPLHGDDLVTTESTSVPAGSTTTMVLRASTASADESDSPALAPGRYTVDAVVRIDGGLFRAPGVPVELVDG